MHPRELDPVLRMQWEPIRHTVSVAWVNVEELATTMPAAVLQNLHIALGLTVLCMLVPLLSFTLLTVLLGHAAM
jgi:hypothetical protein